MPAAAVETACAAAARRLPLPPAEAARAPSAPGQPAGVLLALLLLGAVALVHAPRRRRLRQTYFIFSAISREMTLWSRTTR